MVRFYKEVLLNGKFNAVFTDYRDVYRDVVHFNSSCAKASKGDATNAKRIKAWRPRCNSRRLAR